MKIASLILFSIGQIWSIINEFLNLKVSKFFFIVLIKANRGNVFIYNCKLFHPSDNQFAKYYSCGFDLTLGIQV